MESLDHPGNKSGSASARVGSGMHMDTVGDLGSDLSPVSADESARKGTQRLTGCRIHWIVRGKDEQALSCKETPWMPSNSRPPIVPDTSTRLLTGFERNGTWSIITTDQGGIRSGTLYPRFW